MDKVSTAHLTPPHFTHHTHTRIHTGRRCWIQSCRASCKPVSTPSPPNDPSRVSSWTTPSFNSWRSHSHQRCTPTPTHLHPTVMPLPPPSPPLLSLPLSPSPPFPPPSALPACSAGHAEPLQDTTPHSRHRRVSADCQGNYTGETRQVAHTHACIHTHTQCAASVQQWVVPSVKIC